MEDTPKYRKVNATLGKQPSIGPFPADPVNTLGNYQWYFLLSCSWFVEIKLGLDLCNSSLGNCNVVDSYCQWRLADFIQICSNSQLDKSPLFVQTSYEFQTNRKITK